MRVTNGILLGCPLPLTGSHCKLRRNTEGNNHSDCNPNPNPNPNLNHELRRNTEGTAPRLGFPDAAASGTVPVFTLDSALLGLGSWGCECWYVPVFRQKFTLLLAIGFHAFAPPLEALPCV